MFIPIPFEFGGGGGELVNKPEAVISQFVPYPLHKDERTGDVLRSKQMAAQN